MKIKSVKYVKSSIDVKYCPFPDKPEFAFVGRSNVGKSSLINMLVNHKNLAHTSSKPGKTRTINHYLVNEKWYLTDLPGYGYARTGKKQKTIFSDMITFYVSKRPNLMMLFVLVDARLEPQKIDLDFIKLLGISQVPFAIIFTKTDKISKNELNKNLNLFKKQLLKDWEELPQIFISSALNGTGKKEILNYIEDIIKQWKKPKIIKQVL